MKLRAIAASRTVKRNLENFINNLILNYFLFIKRAMGPTDSSDSCMKYSGRPTISLLLMLDYAASELAGQAVCEVLLYKIASEKVLTPDSVEIPAPESTMVDSTFAFIWAV